METIQAQAAEACYNLFEAEQNTTDGDFIAVDTICIDPGEQGNGYWQVVVKHVPTGKLFSRTFCCHSEWGIIDSPSDEVKEVEAVEVKIIKYVPKKLSLDSLIRESHFFISNYVNSKIYAN